MLTEIKAMIQQKREFLESAELLFEDTLGPIEDTLFSEEGTESVEPLEEARPQYPINKAGAKDTETYLPTKGGKQTNDDIAYNKAWADFEAGKIDKDTLNRRLSGLTESSDPKDERGNKENLKESSDDFLETEIGDDVPDEEPAAEPETEESEPTEDMMDTPIGEEDEPAEETVPLGSDDVGDLMNVTIDLGSNVVTDVLPVAPLGAGDAVVDDDMMSTRIGEDEPAGEQPKPEEPAEETPSEDPLDEEIKPEDESSDEAPADEPAEEPTAESTEDPLTEAIDLGDAGSGDEAPPESSGESEPQAASKETEVTSAVKDAVADVEEEIPADDDAGAETGGASKDEVAKIHAKLNSLTKGIDDAKQMLVKTLG